MRVIALIASVAFLLLSITTVRAQLPGGSPEARKIENPVAATAASVTAGAAAYKKYCAFCHGATGMGDGPLAPRGTMPADLTDDTWDRGSSDGEIFAVIMEGAGPDFAMKGFKGTVPDQDAWHIVNFLRSLGPKGSAR